MDIGDKKATEKSSQALREKPSQDKKTLQKLTPESVPLYMHGYMGGAHPQLMYTYAPLIPGQHLNPAAMGDLGMPPPTPTATVPESKTPAEDEKSGEKESGDSKECDVTMNDEEKQEKESKDTTTEVSEEVNDNNNDNDKGDEKAVTGDGKRKVTDFEEVESPSASKQQKTEIETVEEEVEEENQIVYL
jgi:hypothetical protein